MDESEMRRLVRNRLGVQMEDEMTRYVLKRATEARANSAASSPVHVIGGDARTGVAIRMIVPPEFLLTAAKP